MQCLQSWSDSADEIPVFCALLLKSFTENCHTVIVSGDPIKRMLSTLLALTLLAMGPGAAWAGDACMGQADQTGGAQAEDSNNPCHDSESDAPERMDDKQDNTDCCDCNLLCTAPGLITVASPDLRHDHPGTPMVLLVNRSPLRGFSHPPFRPPILG